MVLNYNGKHTEALFERLVGTEPTHPFAPLQRRHQCQTWVILSRTELPIVNYGVWGIGRLTDDCDAGRKSVCRITECAQLIFFVRGFQLFMIKLHCVFCNNNEVLVTRTLPVPGHGY